MPSQTVQTGVRYSAILPGLIPEIEERDAARFGGYTWQQWRELPLVERVDGVAYYRMTRIVEIHKEDAVSTDMKLRARRSGSKGRR